MNERLGVAKAARAHPDRVAVSDDFGASLSYGEFDELIDRTIHALGQMGIGPGGQIALLAGNRMETVLVHQVAYRGGIYFTPLNPQLRHNEVSYVLRDSGSSVLVTDVLYREVAEAAAGEVGIPVVAIGDSGGDGLLTLAAAQDAEPVPYQFGSVVSYTSGTTGVPKGVIRERLQPTQEQIDALFSFGLRLDMDPEHDRHLATAPLYHGGPLISVFHVLNLGGSVHVMRRFEPEQTLRHIEEKRITSAYMVPTMYHRLLQLPEAVRQRYDTSSLRSVMHTGAPCSIEIKERMLDWLGPVVYECYAATEGYGTYTVCTPQDARSHPGTVGKPPPGLIAIKDGEGRALPPGEVGLVYAATIPGFAPFTYKGDESKTERAYHDDGRYTIGDMGYLDEDGYLYLTGRATDMIISGGVNIYPAEAEHVLLQHRAVADVGVFGIADPEWGERVVAVIQPTGPVADESALEAELIAFCREQLAGYKCPRRIYFLDDLGRDPSGKLRKRHLKETVAALIDGTA